MKKCEICNLNIVDAYWDRHVGGHVSKSREEHVARSVAQRTSVERFVSEQFARQAASNACPHTVTSARRYDLSSEVSSILGAWKVFCGAVRTFPDNQFKALALAIEDVKLSESIRPVDVFRLQQFVKRWCSEDDFGRIEFEWTHRNESAMNELVDAANRLTDRVDSILNVEDAETVEELNFQIACMDAGCIPPLVYGCSKQSVRDLRDDLANRRKELLSLARTGRRYEG